MICLLVVLVKLLVVARKTPLKKSNRVGGFISTKLRPKNVYVFLGVVYYFIVLLCLVPSPTRYISYFYRLIYHVSTESAIKHQSTNYW